MLKYISHPHHPEYPRSCPLGCVCVNLPIRLCAIPAWYRRATRYPRDELDRNPLFRFSLQMATFFLLYQALTLHPSVYLENTPPYIRGVI